MYQSDQQIREIQELKEVLYSFVSVMAAAIDERTPYNGNHTRKVAMYVEQYIRYHNKQWKQGKGNKFIDAKTSELLILAAKLHDIGKIVTPLSIMNKATRLEGQIEKIKERFMLLEAYLKIDYLEHRIQHHTYLQEIHYLEEAMELVENINNSSTLLPEKAKDIEKLIQKQYYHSNKECISYITKEEADCLLIQKGTLTEEERKIMENHVTITSKLLSNIHFNDYYKDVPLWAGAHHELLDGEGYPNHLSGDEISSEVRILTVADIFDALTSSDRPYKDPVSIESAFETLDEMVEEGKLDRDIVSQFKEAVSV